MNRIVEALNAGWIISSVAYVLAHGENDEGRGFLVTLMEPNRHMSRKFYLPFSKETLRFLSN